ncbi:MAG: class I SAM-dependent methyltransferase [Euryarchaeota archaeon]|nr:class I SAM-dependent methyltransferase [Euryarchaeota archaeon]
MLTLVPETVEQYARRHSTPMGPVFEALEATTKERTDVPQMQVGPLEGAFLRLLVGAIGAKRVLEVGTFTGYSALAMAEALPEDGEVVTLDVDADAVAIAQEHWSRSPHGKKIVSVIGDARETIIGQKGPFDLVFIDADKESYLVYYEAALARLRPGGLIIVDNTLWGGAVLEPKETSDLAIVAFNEHVRADDRVENVLLTVRDGMMLVRKRP